MLQDSSLSSVEEKKSFDENSSQELSLQSLSEISGGRAGSALSGDIDIRISGGGRGSEKSFRYAEHLRYEREIREIEEIKN